MQGVINSLNISMIKTIRSLQIKNFGPIKELEIPSLSNINVFIGENGCGKTHVLKAIYASIKSIEQFKRGKEIRSIKELLSDKLYWTFQPDSLGDLVNKSVKEELLLKMTDLEKRTFSFSFKDSTTKIIQNIDNQFLPTETNSIFIPAKEILSSRNIIIKSKEINKEFGFDDTYYDLAKALMPAMKGGNSQLFSDTREEISEMIKGKIQYKKASNEWIFKDNNNYEFPIGITSEGIKKVSIFETLLDNGYLTKNSMVFIDEPEANLHPGLLSKFMEILFQLSKTGMQIFLATHSYFVVKKLYIIAKKEDVSIPIISFENNGAKISDLKDDFPENPIITESINLYKEELSL